MARAMGNGVGGGGGGGGSSGGGGGGGGGGNVSVITSGSMERQGRGGSCATAASSGTFYGREAFEPGRIVLQIAGIHAGFYATFAALLFVLNHVLGVVGVATPGGRGRGALIADQMLSYRALSLRTAGGTTAALALSISSVCCGSIAFVLFVGRARRALDFAATMMAVHLLCCTLYGGVPRTFTWWGLNVACTAAMTVVCEMASRRVELREIAVSGRDRDVEAALDEDVVRPA